MKGNLITTCGAGVMGVLALVGPSFGQDTAPAGKPGVSTPAASPRPFLDHQLFLVELMRLAEPDAPAGARLSDEQVSKLVDIERRFRESVRASVNEVREKSQKVDEARDEVQKAVGDKQAAVNEIDQKLAALRSEMETLREKLQKLPPGSPERGKLRAEIDAKRAEVDKLKAEKDSARAESDAKLEEKRAQKSDRLAERGAAATKAMTVSACEAELRSVLTPEQIKLFETRLAAAKASLARFGPPANQD